MEHSPKGARSVPETAVYLGISRTKCFNEIRAGRLRALKAGRSTLVTQGAAEQWLQSLPSRQVD